MLSLALAMGSHRVFSQSVTVVLTPGWNWISCPSTDTLDFATAFGSFVPEVGDVIKSRWGSSNYLGNGQWRGRISQFYPGYGFMYYSNRTMPVMVTFTVQQPAPQVIVTTAEPTDITTNSATCGGNVASNDGNYVFVILRGICWSTNPNPTFNDNYVEVGNGIGSFTASMTELTPNTTFHVRAYAVTPNGTTYGNEISFTTLDDGSNYHEYVDLGLPSGTLWATCNVGASSPEEHGDYFAWGETQPKEYYDWSTYQYCNGGYNRLTKYCFVSEYGFNGFTDNLNTLLPEDDAATANWGNSWRMPTEEEWQELYQNTTNIWTTQNGINGMLFTASNGNSLFLPAAGYRNGNNLYSMGYRGDYHSSSLVASLPYYALYFYCYSDGFGIAYGISRCTGQTIRAVRSTAQNSSPTGAINGLFSVSDSTQVYFSQGNLQYQASTNTWRFAENQWDFVGSAVVEGGGTGGTVSGSSNHLVSSSYDGWIDLFGWGTSGYNHGAVCFQPWSISETESDYYAYGMQTTNLYNQTGQADWGYNAIINGGDQLNEWRTLTADEWYYILNSRVTTTGNRYAKGQVNGVNGIIILTSVH